MRDKELVQLYENQTKNFELARKNYEALQKVVYRDISFGNYNIRLQYNPARILSTNAKTDQATLQARPCFLCPQYMPRDQQGIEYDPNYHIFINPYPIFKPHFTAPSQKHEPQLMGGRITDMLNMAFDFPEYTIFYNGPECGASAPDHFHFQIVPRHSMPLEADTDKDILRETLVRKDYYSLFRLKDYLREVIIVQASDQGLLQKLFHQVTECIGSHIPYTQEPMMNLICWFDNCQWTLCIFPRKTLRPWQFYAGGNEKVMFSPGAVDMAGLVVAPRKEDFDNYSVPLLTDLYSQVTIGGPSRTKLINDLQKL